jgi:hypothetical protein
VHEPAAALAQLPGAHMFEVYPSRATAMQQPWPPTYWC